jgi:hypothetical protein
MKSKETPIFIVGNGRSGTTMLGQILTKANVGVSFEGHFVVKALKKFGLDIKSQLELKNLIKFILGFESSKRFNFILDPKDYDLDKSLTTRRVLTDALEKIANKHPELVWIEKTPHYINDLGLIFEVFPDAKIIWMLRDGRDVANSVFKKSWGANNSFYAAKDWVHSNYNNESLKDPRILLVKYEKLLTNPLKGLEKIFTFLEFQCDSISELADRINPDKMYQWKNKMTRQQLNTFESVAFDCLKKFEYETVNKNRPTLHWFQMLFYETHHHALWIKHLIRVNIVNLILIKLGSLLPFDESN